MSDFETVRVAIGGTWDAREALDRIEAGAERLREERDILREELTRTYAEIERLRAALNKAGDRLAQVQPAVCEEWALDIVPRAEQEIADALGQDVPRVTAAERAEAQRVREVVAENNSPR